MTLIEMLVAIAIFTLTMAALTGGIFTLYRTNSYALAQAEQIDLARQGVEELTRDLREMVFAEDGAFPLVRMQPHIVGFYSDVHATSGVEYVEYELATTTRLTRRVYFATGGIPAYNLATSSLTESVSNYVQNLVLATSTFTYFTASGTPTTTAAAIADIRYISAQLLVNADPNRNPTPFILRTSTMLRNLKDNL
jgi:type II secretory pathway component PulJ